MSTRKNEARDWLYEIVNPFLPGNARRYTFKIMTGEIQTSSLGFQVDMAPAEGKVVAENDKWLLIKVGRIEFFVASKDLLQSIPEIGSTVLITPYHRRRFDGKEVGAPDVTESGNGFRCQSFRLGDDNSRIPLDKDQLQSSFLRDMVNQIEKLPVGDGVRNIGNALVDAGGANPGLSGYKDPSDHDAAVVPPSIGFNIDTQKFKGALVVEYDRSMDYYNVLLLDNGEEVKRVENVDFTTLGAVVIDLVDDGLWKIATVEILKKAPKKKAA